EPQATNPKHQRAAKLTFGDAQVKRPVRLCRQATSSPAPHGPGARSARRSACARIVSQTACARETPTMLFHSWLRSLRSSPKPNSRRPRRTHGLRLEPLEDRTVPSTCWVTNTGDNLGANPAAFAGTGTLRQAIIDANATAGLDTIKFNIPASDLGHLYYTNVSTGQPAFSVAADDAI